jgi:hypothetical protein
MIVVVKSGGRQPAVGVGNAPATPIPHTFGDTRLVRKQERRASARRGRGKLVCADESVLVRRAADGVWGNRRCIRVNCCHGGLTPPALGCTHAYRRRCAVAIRYGVLFHASIAARTLADEKTIFAMHKRTSGSRAAGVSPPWAWVTHLQGRFRKVAGDCRQCAHERRCSRVQRCREGPTLIPAPALRDFQSLSSRAGFPRGANAPRSCTAMRTSGGEKTIFAMHKRTLAQERRA